MSNFIQIRESARVTRWALFGSQLKACAFVVSTKTPSGAHPVGVLPLKMEGTMEMEKFIERQNIARFTIQLMAETDTNKREMLHKLLAEEIVKQASGATQQT